MGGLLGPREELRSKDREEKKNPLESVCVGGVYVKSCLSFLEFPKGKGKFLHLLLSTSVMPDRS